MRRCFIHRTFIGGELPEAPILPRKQARFLSPVGVLAVRAALYTSPAHPMNPSRRGVFSNTGPSRFDPSHLGSRLGNIDPDGPLWRGALSEVDPFSLLKIMSSSVLAIVSMMLPAEGRSAHLCEDSIGGLRALQLAKQAIEDNDLDDAVVIAFDDLTSPLSLAEVSSQKISPSSTSVALVHLSCMEDGSTGELGRFDIEDNNPTIVGGAEGLARFLRAKATGA
jgi:3-oxoacyl-(acyl-carrier-protein) synthase